MRIEFLASKPDRAGRYTLRFEDGTSLRLYRQTVEDFRLFTGLELSEEEMDALRTAAGQMSAKMRAVRIVSASSVSKKELEQRGLTNGDTKFVVTHITHNKSEYHEKVEEIFAGTGIEVAYDGFETEI